MKNANDYDEKLQTSYSEFSQRLDYVMKIRSVTNKALGEHLFVSASTISGYRTGKRSPNIDVLRQICQELSVSSDYLLGLSDQFDIFL